MPLIPTSYKYKQLLDPKDGLTSTLSTVEINCLDKAQEGTLGPDIIKKVNQLLQESTQQASTQNSPIIPVIKCGLASTGTDTKVPIEGLIVLLLKRGDPNQPIEKILTTFIIARRRLEQEQKQTAIKK